MLGPKYLVVKSFVIPSSLCQILHAYVCAHMMGTIHLASFLSAESYLFKSVLIMYNPKKTAFLTRTFKF